MAYLSESRTEPSTFSALEIERDEAHPRFCEALRIMIEAWTKPHCSADSGPWTFSNVAVGPPPVQKPHPPIYVAGVSEETVDIAARHGSHPRRELARVDAAGGALGYRVHELALEIVEELPRNTMGKIQKNVLRDTYKSDFA